MVPGGKFRDGAGGSGRLRHYIALAAGLGAVFFAIPAALHLMRANVLVTSVVQALATMCFSALLIHLGHGMIEMHFHIFVSLAMMIVYGTPVPMMMSAAAIAAHHVVFFFLIPQILLNHHCRSFSIVLIHAGFVIAEVIPGAFIASRFGRFTTAQQVATGQLSTSAADMAHAARGVDEVNRAVHSFAGTQSNSLAELLRANGSVRAISSENARRAGEALGIARAVCEPVEKGNEFLKLLRRAITEFSESSGKIGRITRTIDEIAFQTNILALNAAVEAARAGESGVGFAVVADEVRSLAQKSAAAARDTAGLIDTSLQGADEGVSRLRHVGDVFDEILSRSTRLSESVTDVNASIEQQCRDVDQVRNLTERIQVAMCGMKEKTAAGTAAGDVLIQNAEQLQALVHEIAALTG